MKGTTQYKLQGNPGITVRAREAHVSLSKTLSTRRLCLMLDTEENINKLVLGPVFIQVHESSLLNVSQTLMGYSIVCWTKWNSDGSLIFQRNVDSHRQYYFHTVEGKYKIVPLTDCYVNFIQLYSTNDDTPTTRTSINRKWDHRCKM